MMRLLVSYISMTQSFTKRPVFADLKIVDGDEIKSTLHEHIKPRYELGRC